MDSNSFIQALMKAAASKQENGEDPIIDLSTLENFAPDAAEEPTFSEDGRDWPFDKLAYEYRLLGAPSIDLVSAEDLTPLVFYRDFVSKNLPVLIDGAIDKWPALTKWKSDEYLRSVIGETEVTVDFTPDGRGDSIVQDKLFVTPCEEKLKFSEFLNLLQDDAGEDGESEGESKQGVSNGSSSAASISSTASPTAGSSSSRPSRPGVPYCQHQNSSFCDEFKSLHQDAALDISFATEAFGAKPEAVNFWMGDTRSVSSMHSDPYENMYAVVRGEKHFTLLPPTDYYWLSRQTLPRAVWQRKGSQSTSQTTESSPVSSSSSSGGEIVCGDFIARPAPEGDIVPWIDVDVKNPRPGDERKVNFTQLCKFDVVVRPGQVLYLPSGWYHRVAQRGKTIAVNYWYEMAYDGRFALLEFMRHVADRQRKQQAETLKRIKEEAEARKRGVATTGEQGEGEEINKETHPEIDEGKDVTSST